MKITVCGVFMSLKLFWLIAIPSALGVLAMSLTQSYKYETQINELKAEKLELEKELLEARQAIVEQNLAIADFKITIKKKEDEAALQQKRTVTKYERLLKESRESLAADNSCDSQLNIIQNTWREFLYE